MGIMKTLATAKKATTTAKPTSKPTSKAATPAKAAPPAPAPVEAAVGSHQNTVANGTPAIDGATITAATRKRKYRAGYKAVLVVQRPDGTHYRRIVGEPQETEEKAMAEAERVKAAFEKAGKIPA